MLSPKQHGSIHDKSGGDGGTKANRGSPFAVPVRPESLYRKMNGSEASLLSNMLADGECPRQDSGQFPEVTQENGVRASLISVRS
jgi:hypothetical protein